MNNQIPDVMNDTPDMTLLKQREAALAWCNWIRGRKGMEFLTELPKGILGNKESCPCGAATKMKITYHEYFDKEALIPFGELPKLVGAFAKSFDNQKYPDLILGRVEEIHGSLTIRYEQ